MRDPYQCRILVEKKKRPRQRASWTVRLLTRTCAHLVFAHWRWNVTSYFLRYWLIQFNFTPNVMRELDQQSFQVHVTIFWKRTHTSWQYMHIYLLKLWEFLHLADRWHVVNIKERKRRIDERVLGEASVDSMRFRGLAVNNNLFKHTW